jgi:hypothetical protein
VIQSTQTIFDDDTSDEEFWFAFIDSN